MSFDPEEIEEAPTEKMPYAEPRYVVSFINGSPGLVVRGDTARDIESSMTAILPYFKRFREAVEKASASQSNAPKTDDQRVMCQTCGAPMEYRSGFSKKTNNNWKGYFCTKDKEHEPTWL